MGLLQRFVGSPMNDCVGWLGVLRPSASEWRQSADSGRSGARGLTSQIDP